MSGCVWGELFLYFILLPPFSVTFSSKEMVEILAELGYEWLTLDVLRRVVRPAAAVVLTRIYAVLRTGAIVA